MPTIAVCTSSPRSSITAFLEGLQSLDVNIKFIKLPYNDLDSFSLTSGSVDGLILCHSIHNRRFAITDVFDALYDKFLPHAEMVYGKENIVVIAHDFPWKSELDAESMEDHARIKEARQKSFHIQQPTTFQCTNLALICGRLDTEIQMDADEWDLLEMFTSRLRKRSASTRCRLLLKRLYKWASDLVPILVGMCMVGVMMVGPAMFMVWKCAVYLFGVVAALLASLRIREEWVSRKCPTYAKLKETMSRFFKTFTGHHFTELASLIPSSSSIKETIHEMLPTPDSIRENAHRMYASIPPYPTIRDNVCDYCAAAGNIIRSTTERLCEAFTSHPVCASIKESTWRLFGAVPSFSTVVDKIWEIYAYINEIVLRLYALIPSCAYVKEYATVLLSPTQSRVQKSDAVCKTTLSSPAITNPVSFFQAHILKTKDQFDLVSREVFSSTDITEGQRPDDGKRSFQAAVELAKLLLLTWLFVVIIFISFPLWMPIFCYYGACDIFRVEKDRRKVCVRTGASEE